MRFPLMILAAVCTGEEAFARDDPTEIHLSTEQASKQVSGTTSANEPTSFFYRSPDRRDLVVKVGGENGICGFEVQRSSARGFQSDFDRFPASRSFKVQEGETFTFSFFQTRNAMMKRKLCTYTLSLQ
jgi:hypothetical protein